MKKYMEHNNPIIIDIINNVNFNIHFDLLETTVEFSSIGFFSLILSESVKHIDDNVSDGSDFELFELKK
jgi:hypothetical protein